MANRQTAAKYRKSRTGIVYLIVIILLIAAALVLACTVFFRVESVTVEGNQRYSQEQILSVANVDMGANLILTSGDLIAQRLYDSLPYVDRVTVRKRFPTTLRLEITETTPVAVISAEDGTRWLMDPRGKILEQVDESAAQYYIQVQGLQAAGYQPGKVVEVEDSYGNQLRGLLELLQVLQDRGMAAQITSINASSRTELIMVYDGRLQAKMLNNVDFNRKILILEEIAAVLGENEQGIIDMKTEKVFYSPTYY